MARVHCKGLGEPRSTNDLDLAFGNVLTSTLEKQTKATEEMFEIKLADHKDELNEMFDSKQKEQRHQIGDDLDAKFENQKDGFVQELDDKLDQQRDEFVQVLNDKMADHKDELIEMFDAKQEEQRNKIEDDIGQVLNVKLEQQKDGFVQILDDKMDQQKDEFVQLLEKQKNDFVQLLDDKMEQQTEKCNQRMNEKFEELQNMLLNLGCPAGWNKVSDSCILLSSEYTDFDTAVEKCKDLDAKLYEPQSLSHNQFVYALIEKIGLEGSDFWIGLHDKHTENSFVYQSNNQPIEFQHWGSFNDEFGAQPNNNRGNQNCVAINRAQASWNGPKGSWNDYACSLTNNRFICEKEAQ